MIQLVLFLLIMIHQAMQKLSECHCYNVLDSTICEKSKACKWQISQCENNLNYNKQSFTECSSFLMDDCVQQPLCAYINNQCTIFTTCDVMSDCKQSTNCIDDGNKCINKNFCVNYQTQVACSNKAINNAYCIWNVNKNPKCQEIQTCQQLPQLRSHQNCKLALNICTVNEQGYCQEQLKNCADYKIQQCFETIDNNECFWDYDSMMCLERKCENAKYSTDNECKLFKNDCTTNGINCVQRLNCQSLTHKNGCIVDNQNNKCYWNGQMCIDKKCSSIPNGYNCYSFFNDLKCVSTINGRCKDMPTNCQGFETQITCNEDYLNIECFWLQGNCKQKTCSNAPQFTNCAIWKKNNSCVGDTNSFCIELPTYCSQVTDMTYCYKELSGSLCQFYSCSIAFCSKAPNYFNSHIQCEQWNIDCTVNLELGGCINKLKQCENYNNQEQCHSTLDKIQCIYLNQQCIQKTCELGIFSNNLDCQNWDKNCIINQYYNQCIQWPSNCQELMNQYQCYLGLQNGQYCEWNGINCINQSNLNLCVNAINNNQFDQHEKCNRWNGQCTVIQKVYGCQARQNCEDYLFDYQCKVGIDNQQCYWNGSSCYNKCSQKQNETVQFNDCQTLNQSCTLNNLKAVCIYKTYCSSYFNQSDCIINHSNQPCKWNSNDKICQDVVCEDNITAVNEYECTYYLNYQQCQLGGIGCITRAQKCSDINNNLLCNNTIPRCKNKYCYYTNGCCNEILANQCELITDATSNEECQKYNDECIFNFITLNGCINYKTCEYINDQGVCTALNGVITLPNFNICLSYNGKCHSQYNCDAYNSNCSTVPIDIKCKALTNGVCSQKLCKDFTGTANAANCNTYQKFCYFSVSTCKTALQCSDFTSLGQTICQSSKTYYGQYCQWIGGQCKIIQCTSIANSCLYWNKQCMQGTSTCIDITTCNQITNQSYCYLAYNIQNLKCLWINSSCLDYFDCTNIYTQNFTEYDCIRYDLCRLNKQSIGCEYKDCKDYTQMEYCNLLTQCKWYNNQCYNKNECQFQLNQIDCENINYCYWNINICKKQVCSNATTQILCNQIILQSGIKCLWLNSICKEQYQCSDIKDPLYFQDCNNQNFNCVIKYTFSDKTNYCQTKKTQCNLYTFPHTCTYDIYNNKCYWNSTTQKCINNQCETYISNNNNYNNIICQQFNINCVININLDGCRYQLTNCNQYLNTQQCLYAKNTLNNYCYWNGVSCIDAQCNQYSTLISPPISCIEYAKCSLINSICIDRYITCNLYLNENECNQSQTQSGQYCAWILNNCQQRQCNNNPNQIYNHSKCQEWLSNCTVNDQLTQCIPIIDCTTAPTEINTITQCEQFISPTNDICTISTLQGGCTNLPINCNLASRTQCYFDQNRKKCYWSQQTGSCKDLICNNIDTTIITSLECESILDSCTISQTGFGCQTKQFCTNYSNLHCQMNNIRDYNNRNCIQGCQLATCEDYLYQTDDLCKSILDGNCITNGIQCITHNTCNDFKFQSQCQISKHNDICYWSIEQSICIIKQCSIADKSQYYNEYLCSQFMNTCTYSIIQDKCIEKGLCQDFDNKEACQLDINNQQCVWYQNQCFIAECQNQCGDGIVDINTEQCDDGNMIPNDGCYQCQYNCIIGCLICDQGICTLCDYEQGYYLNDQEKCIAQCGDQIIQGKEQCDDGNNLQYDGCYECKYQCHYACINCYQGICLECQQGWSINLQEQCEILCGDGYVLYSDDIMQQNIIIEQCDDKNLENNDGCSDQCKIEDHWACTSNQDNQSICYFVDQTFMKLNLVTIKPSIQQQILVSFSQQLKKVKETQQPLITCQLLNLNEQYYNYTIDAIEQPILTQFQDVKYMITINFNKSTELPLLQVQLDNSQLIDINNLNPTQTNQKIRLFTCYYESKSELQISQTTTTINSILLYFLLAIAIIAILTLNLDILWNLLDMVQYLSYVKYVNIQFPQNLNSFFALFDIVTIKPAIQFFKIQELVNIFSYGDEIIIETTNKFKQDNLNAFYFYNFASSIFIFAFSFSLYFSSLIGIKLIFQHHLKFIQHIYIYKLIQPICRILLKFIIYFFYSGILRTIFANTYDLLFTILLQLYYPQFDTILKLISVSIAATTFLALLLTIYFILAKQNNSSLNLNDEFKVLSEETGKSTSLWIRQFNSLLLIKKVIFMLMLIFMQKQGELQTTFISIFHICFSLYLISKQPIKNKFEFYKNLIIETQISFATCLFLAYCVPSFTLDQKYNLGWLHITIFTSILACSVFFDLVQQIKILASKISKAYNQKHQMNTMHSVVLFESLPINRQEFQFVN